ncbi:MAG: hypothetical protein FWC89_13635, partial [Defluviitaleaceae bacterium]|nr:hypothetical protein [Defluviitaleaceae bacterium]
KQEPTQPTTELSIQGFAEVKLLEPPREKTTPTSQSGLRIEIGSIKISATEDYPPENIAEILKRLSC